MGERKSFSVVFDHTGISVGKKKGQKDICFYITPHGKTDKTWIIDLNIKLNNAKFRGENTCKFGSRQRFPRTKKVKFITEKKLI